MALTAHYIFVSVQAGANKIVSGTALDPCPIGEASSTLRGWALLLGLILYSNVFRAADTILVERIQRACGAGGSVKPRVERSGTLG